MKTIILTSSGFKTPKLQSDLLKILPKKPSALKLAHILTASKVSENTDFVDRERAVLQQLGFQVEEGDIEGKNEKSLREMLAGKDIIYVQGGNPFYLLKHVRKSGFESVVRDLINKGVIYVGVSAGSCITSPTIEMSSWRDPKRKRYGLRNLTAMNLVPFLVVVHYNREEYRIGLEEGVKKSKFPARILTDDQALLVTNGKVKLIGSGEEVSLIP